MFVGFRYEWPSDFIFSGRYIGLFIAINQGSLWYNGKTHCFVISMSMVRTATKAFFMLKFLFYFSIFIFGIIIIITIITIIILEFSFLFFFFLS